MKIGIVCYPTFGGSGVVATELGKQLAKKGHEVHFISYDQPFRLEHFTENIFFHEVRVSNYPLFEFAPYESALTSKLVDVVEFEKLDVLHVHYAIPHASAAHLAKEILLEKGIQIPFVTTLHGTDITLVGKDPSFEPVVSFAMNKSDGLTAVSESLKQDTLKHFNVSRHIEVIPNFVCCFTYGQETEKDIRKVYAPNGEKIITHISNFRKVKRVEDVIYTFKKISEKVSAKLMLIGDGPERHKMEKLCRELKTCDDTIFLGKLRSVYEVLKASDLFLLTSLTESFGLSALEAMASGVPVISTNRGGLPEVNVHGESGFLSDVGDIENLAANSIKLLTDDALLEKLKKGALERAKQFDVSKILPLYENLYQKVISGNRVLA